MTGPRFTPEQEAAFALQSIRLQVKRWASFDKEARDREGLETYPDTHIVSPPVWPSHGQLAAWVAALDKAEELLFPKTPATKAG